MSESPDPSTPVHVVLAGPEHRAVLERLWLLFRHDMSEYDGRLPRPDATYRSERLDSALAQPGWAGYLLRVGEAPVGLAVVRSLEREPFVLNSFFVVRAARRSGVGRDAVGQILTARPGRWTVAFQETNPNAVAFWRSVAASHDEGWTEERRPVPDRPDLPPDSWICVRVRG
jgi:predicted acetyltransferase